ncbi:MAG TPA: universal stress protein [Sphingobium sp.]|nr:universal stress protein [Sphingobium sp.]
MTVKLLAVIAQAETTPACLDAAEAAGHALRDAAIEALHVVVDPGYLITASEEVAFQRLRSRHEGTPGERAAATRAAYDAWMVAHPEADIPLRWKERFGAEEETIQREARIFDVLVLAWPTNLDGGDALHAAMHRIQHPFFLVPSQWRLKPGARFAGHIVIAWNGTEACRKALQGALPWLRVAREITLLLIAESRDLAGPAEDLLNLEQIACRVQHVPRGSTPLGDQIIAEAHKWNADLLVMGAYRHPQFIEWLLGGTTRHVLAHFDLPLLLAH